MANDAQMLPCPWCQTKTSLAASQVCTGGGWGIMCKSCHVFLDAREENPTAAIAAWNRRADLCASGQQVRALKWDDFDGQGAKATAMLIASYLIARWSDGRFEISVSAPGYSTGFDGERFHPTLEAAKAAAQADYERRILAALTPAPHPEGQVMDGWIDDKTFIEPLNHATPTAQEAVPVAWRARRSESEEWQHFTSRPSWWEVQPLYAHPPQPSETVAEAGDDLVRAMRLFWEADEAADECRAAGKDLEAARYDKMATGRWQSIPEKIDALDAALRALKGEA